MADFNFVTARLATGAAIGSAADVEALVASGITAVIDCRGELDDASLLASHPELAYLWNPTDDDGARKPPEWFAKGIDFSFGVLIHSHTRLYAHCAAGVNRGPSMAFAILCALGVLPADAEAMIRRARPQVGLRYRDDAIAAVKALGYG